MSTILEDVKAQGRAAKAALSAIANASTGTKNQALTEIKSALEAERDLVFSSNVRDIEEAEQRGISAALLDRLQITDKVFDSMLASIEQIIALPDPVGQITNVQSRPSGIKVGQMRIPVGVIGIIYESRPNVTIEAASLCLKSGNAIILRGGSEAKHSNQALLRCIHEGLEAAGLPKDTVQMIQTTDRAAVGQLITMDESVDVIIPRGGKGLIERITKEATIPVIKHLDGVCHVFIDDDANTSTAIEIADNAKTQRYGTCNTMETLLVAKSVAEKVLHELYRRYTDKGVELRGCEQTKALLPDIKDASATDWSEEYLAPILAIKVVGGIDDAINHINTYGSGHTDSIVTENYTKAMQFLRAVDSSSVMVNASTRFADGFEYGLGAEIGISTNKLHARGPVGLEGLTTQKFIVFGEGQIRT